MPTVSASNSKVISDPWLEYLPTAVAYDRGKVKYKEI
jgi:hypothetical protein